MCFALSIFAQDKPFPFTPIPAGPQLGQQIEAINQKSDEAFNDHDAAAVGALSSWRLYWVNCQFSTNR
jgi:hypothetical protein